MQIERQVSCKAAQSKPTVSIVLDSVNHYRSVKEKYGPDAEPNWGNLLSDAKRAGFVTAAVAVVNRGVNPALWNRFEDAGYLVRRALADDCDEFVIAEIVKTSRRADVVVIGGGDHKYADIAALLRQLGKKVIVTAVPGTVARELLNVSDTFVDLPVSRGVPPDFEGPDSTARMPATVGVLGSEEYVSMPLHY